MTQRFQRDLLRCSLVLMVLSIVSRQPSIRYRARLSPENGFLVVGMILKIVVANGTSCQQGERGFRSAGQSLTAMCRFCEFCWRALEKGVQHRVLMRDDRLSCETIHIDFTKGGGQNRLLGGVVITGPFFEPKQTNSTASSRQECFVGAVMAH